MGGYPIQLMGGVPHSQSRWRGGTPSSWPGGTPFPGLDGGYPLPGGTPPGKGVPPSAGLPPLGRGYPSPPTGGTSPHQTSTVCTCYAAGGVPLAFTQEDFLVDIWKLFTLKTPFNHFLASGYISGVDVEQIDSILPTGCFREELRGAEGKTCHWYLSISGHIGTYIKLWVPTPNRDGRLYIYCLANNSNRRTNLCS